jgi:hypothetical protein
MLLVARNYSAAFGSFRRTWLYWRRDRAADAWAPNEDEKENLAAPFTLRHDAAQLRHLLELGALSGEEPASPSPGSQI